MIAAMRLPLIWTWMGLAEPTRIPVVRVSGTATFFFDPGEVPSWIGSPRVLLVPITLPMILFPFRSWVGKWAWMVTTPAPPPVDLSVPL